MSKKIAVNQVIEWYIYKKIPGSAPNFYGFFFMGYFLAYVGSFQQVSWKLFNSVCATLLKNNQQTKT